MNTRFGILGPLQVLENGRSVGPGSRKQQIVLAALLCHANSRVSFDSLADALWDDTPPRTARKNIQVYVSVLRRLVSAGSGSRIKYQTGGYVFQATPDELDMLSFEKRARAGALAEALRLWRGPALDGFRDVPLISIAAQRLERRFLTVFEDWVEAEISAGRGAGTIERLSEIAHEHPLRERLRMLQMTSLCQAGRRSEALAVYDELRQLLAHELGLSPSQALANFYQSLLHEPGPAAPQQAVPSARREVPPSLLPWDLPTFTGRAAATRQLADALVRGNKLAVVTGPLGAGKTALALHVAHQLGDDFPDGRLFVRLRRDDGTRCPLDDVLAQVLCAGSPALLPDTRRAWQLWLTERRALVIVDDARHESEVRPLLPEAGDSAVIVTARPRLAGLEAGYRLSVSSFAMDEAMEFLGQKIGTDRVSADRHSAERIVTAVGLLPLAVRLVAERLALLHHVPLREYATRMTSARALLDELTAGDLAIRARLAEAIGRLPMPAHRAVLRLGMLPEPIFTLKKAAAVLDTGEDTAMRVLETLLEASIITVPDAERLAHSVRYEIPALPYAYAREMATQATPLPISDKRPAIAILQVPRIFTNRHGVTDAGEPWRKGMTRPRAPEAAYTAEVEDIEVVAHSADEAQPDPPGCLINGN